MNEALDTHNTFRKTHHVDELTWNDTLAASAVKWAANCVFEHSGGKLLAGGYGENLFASSGPSTDTSLKSCVTSWNNEESSYDYSNPGFSEATGHFTQVVWKGTSSLGCAMKTCKLAIMPTYDQSTSCVCQYHDAGNIVNDGEFAANVLKP